MKARIKDNNNIAVNFRGQIGEIVAIVKEKRHIEYIVQFTKPTMWSYFGKKEFKCVKKNEPA